MISRKKLVFFLRHQQKPWEGCGCHGLGVWLLHEPLTVAGGDRGPPLQQGTRVESFPKGRNSRLIKKKCIYWPGLSCDGT